MDINAIKQFNFLDIVVLIILFRICYIAIKTGLAIELFKLLGVIFAVYIASHYYTALSDIIRRRYIPSNIPLEFLDFVIFIILGIVSYLGFVLLRSTFYRFMKMEAAPKLNRYGGLILGVARAYFTIGLLVYILLISSVSYLSTAVKYSYLGSRFSSVSAQTYNWIWENIFSKFSPQEKPNSIVNEAGSNSTRK
jgi:uncharacterized membrane protein required for colicin V production